MVAPMDTLASFCRSFGCSYVKTYQESASTANIRKFWESIPGVSVAYICLEKHYYPREISKLEITRVALSSSVVGLPFLLVADLVSSVSAQLIYAYKTHDKRELEKKVYS